LRNTVFMEEMTWKEIKQSIEEGKDTAILVAASMEQHGPHLPIATDTIIGYALAGSAAQRLGNALVAPVIRPALSQHHVGFPGTITFRMKTFLGVLKDCCSGLKAHGFRNAVLFVSHGGNMDALKAFTPYIARDIGNDMRIHLVFALERFMETTREILDKQGITPEKAGVHAGFSETALMLYLRPDLVDMNLAGPGLVEEKFYRRENLENFKISTFIHGIGHFSWNGILGDPMGADARVGEEIFQATVEGLVEEIRQCLGMEGGKES